MVSSLPVLGRRVHVDRGAPVPCRSEHVAAPGPVRRGDQRKLQRRRVDVAGRGGSGGVQGGPAAAQGHHRHRELVDAVRADQPGDRDVGETRVQPGGDTGGVRGREQLGQHGAGVPQHVPVAPFAVAPAGAPRDAGDHDRRGVAARRRADPDQGVLVRVVPVHAGGQRRSVGDGDVELQREAAARGSGGAEQIRAVGTLDRADHAGRQVQQPGEPARVELGGGDVGRAREDGDGGRRGGGQIPRQGYAGQVTRVPLVEPGQPVEVVDLEVPDHPGVVDGVRPLATRLVGGQAVQRLCRGLHAWRRYAITRRGRSRLRRRRGRRGRGSATRCAGAR
jgi:hypothetical protein